MLTFRRVTAGHYRATAPNGAIYNIEQGDSGWVVTREGAPLSEFAEAFTTYGAARDAANAYAEQHGDGNPESPIDLAGDEGPADAPEAENVASETPSAPASLDEMDEAESVTESAPLLISEDERFAPLTEADRPELTSLLPDERPEGRSVNATLARIDRSDWERITPPVEMVESVRRFGVFQPVALIETGNRDVPFRIAAGRRRVAAAAEVGLDYVPAYVYPRGTPAHVAASIALAENMNRRPNPISELEQIEALVAEGATEAMIARDLHIPLAVVRRRIRLQNLIPEFRNALLAGQINATICQDIARHDEREQRIILGIFESNGRVTAADLRRIRNARDGQVSVPELEAADRVAAVDDALASAAGNEGWGAVLIALQAAERAIPAAADDATDTFFAELHALQQRVQRMTAGAR
jgi:ParB/RepB/Spo0J family partition protein